MTEKDLPSSPLGGTYFPGLGRVDVRIHLGEEFEGYRAYDAPELRILPDPKLAELLPLVYSELRRLAAARLSGEKAGQTLDATGLVHEAYLRLVGNHRAKIWDGRGHFFASAAEAMRRILIENARRKQGPRRGGDRRRINADLDQIGGNSNMNDIDLLDLDEALEKLAEESPVRALLVKLRYFAGLTIPEAAASLGISVATAERYWAYARVRLYAALAEPPTSSAKTDSA